MGGDEKWLKEWAKDLLTTDALRTDCASAQSFQKVFSVRSVVKTCGNLTQLSLL